MVSAAKVTSAVGGGHVGKGSCRAAHWRSVRVLFFASIAPMASPQSSKLLLRFRLLSVVFGLSACMRAMVPEGSCSL